MENIDENQKELTVREVAERLDVSEETVRRWIRAGKLDSNCDSRKGGHRIKYKDFVNFVNQNTVRYQIGTSYDRRNSNNPVTAVMQDLGIIPSHMTERIVTEEKFLPPVVEETVGETVEEIIQTLSFDNVNSPVINPLISELNDIKVRIDEIEGRINDYRHEILKCEEELGSNKKKFDMYKRFLVEIKESGLIPRPDEISSD